MNPPSDLSLRMPYEVTDLDEILHMIPIAAPVREHEEALHTGTNAPG